MIDACAVGSRWRTLECEVPFEKVGLERSCVECGIRVSLELGGFFEDPFYRGRLGVECGKRHHVACESVSVQDFVSALVDLCVKEGNSCGWSR